MSMVKLIPILFLLATILHLGHCYPLKTEDDEIYSNRDLEDDMVRKGNAIVDDFLSGIQFKLNDEFEPIDLPEKSFGFEKRIALVTIKGEIKIYNGYLAGFSSLHRIGDAKLYKYKDVSILTVPLGVSNLLGHYKGHAKFMNHGPSIEVDLKAGSLTAEMRLMQHEGDAKPEVTYLDLKKVRDTDVKVDGLGPLDFILSKFYDFVVGALKNFVTGWLETPVKEWLNEQLQKDAVSIRD